MPLTEEWVRPLALDEPISSRGTIYTAHDTAQHRLMTNTELLPPGLDLRSAALGFFDYLLRGEGVCRPVPLPPCHEQSEEKLMAFAKDTCRLRCIIIDDYVT